MSTTTTTSIQPHPTNSNPRHSSSAIGIMPNERSPPKTSQLSRSQAFDLDSDDSLEEVTRMAFDRSLETTNPGMGGHPVVGKAAAKSKTSSIFNQNKRRAEHHKLAANPTNAFRIFPEQPPNLINPPYKMPTRTDPPMFSSHGPGAHPIKGSGTQVHVDPYQDTFINPKDAEAAIKDLLEGAMDDDENDGPGADEPEAKSHVSSDPVVSPSNQTQPLTESTVLDTSSTSCGPQEDGSFEGVTVQLLPHQVEGVKWMRQREVGPVKKGRIPKGGILADDMGLGKTLQSICLMLCNRKPAKGSKGYKKHFDSVERTTLVVAPLALIRQWEAELKDKVSPDEGLKVYVHHGPQRTKSFKELASYDIVITTYQILVSEHGNTDDSLGGIKAGCFGLSWWRVILDEAHSIKNRNAKSTKACYALRSEYRWCLTGTPLQNNLDELQSLIRFLRISPYDDFQEWKQSIVQVLNSNRGHIAIRRLHAFLRCIMKRRKKEILKEEGALVPGGKAAMERAKAQAHEQGSDFEAAKPAFKTTARNVKSIVLKFSPAEKKYYENLENRADESLSRMMKQGVNYANALVLLLRMRQACNHPKLVGSKMDKDRDALGSEVASSKVDSDVDSLADALGGLGIKTKKCEICLRDLKPQEVNLDHEMCSECHSDLVWFENQGESDKQKKREEKKAHIEKQRRDKKKMSHRRSHARRSENVEDGNDTDDGEGDGNATTVIHRAADARRRRNRKVIVDSDDEEQGSWLVSEGEQGSLHLGKAGGSDDENCEGGGETILSNDEDDTSSTDEEDASKLSGFVVDDDDDDGDGRYGDPEITYSDFEELPSLLAVENRQKTKKSSRPSHISQVAEDDNDDYHSDAASGDNDGHADETFDSDDTASGSVDSPQLHRDAKQSHVLASAKIRELIKILESECREHKFIVFSQFTSMLDLIEPFLRKNRIGFVRYDGAMRNDMREASLHSLREDKNTRVLLCSLKCGSLGLNLTAATRVIIVEPFWNPFIEEQAIDRVHRLTQKVDVTVYKLTVGDTVEERILELQEKKRLLAESAIEGSQNKKFKLGLNINELMSLFRSTDHDGRHGGSGNTGDGATKIGRGGRAGENRGDESLNNVGEVMQSMKGLMKKSRVPE